MPRYEHDCDHCVYLGAIGAFDVWYCPAPHKYDDALILRYGDDPAMYSSFDTDTAKRMRTSRWQKAVALLQLNYGRVAV